MNTFFYQDRKWLEVSASLRSGILYVKMPRSKARQLVQILQAAEKDLLEKQIEASEKSFVFYGPAPDWHKDLRALQELLEWAPSEELPLLYEVIRALQQGLRCDPGVDWIHRVGGPAPVRNEALGGLEPSPCSSCASEACPAPPRPSEVEFIDL